MNNFIEYALAAMILIPLLMFFVVVVLRVINSVNYSRVLNQLVIAAQSVLFLFSLGLLLTRIHHDPLSLKLFLYKTSQLAYQFSAYFDLYTASLLLLVTLICGVISHFSINYLAHEEGYYKFFINFYVLQLSLYSLILTSNFFYILIAWELLGLASVFLISFYQSSSKAVSNSLYVLGIYKFCDIFLILALLVFHKEQHHLLISVPSHPVSSGFLLVLLIASMGKSALFPFSKWVPRAMEGPTTSSAIFYGALSIHAGMILLLKFKHIFVSHAHLNALIIGMGISTAVYASLKSRIQTDIKSMLAYATIAQVGLMYIEFGLGLYPLVLIHLISNALLKTYQFTRSPSNIHHFHHLEKLNFRQIGSPGLHFRLIPKKLRIWTYKLVYHNFGLTLFWQTFAVVPFRAFQTLLSRGIDSLIRYFSQFKIFKFQSLVLALSLGGVVGLVFLEQRHFLNPIYLAAGILLISIAAAISSLKHVQISDYLIKIKLSYFGVSVSAILFFGSFLHDDAMLYFLGNLISLFILDYFIRYLSRRLDLQDIRSYLGIGNRFKYINMIAISILLMLTFTPGFATFIVFDIILEDISEKSRLVLSLFLVANTLNVFSIFKFVFKIIFGESQTYLNEYPDFSVSERVKLAVLIVPMIAMGVIPLFAHY